jgi:arsenate reductase-like glutaredoxin family protein
VENVSFDFDEDKTIDVARVAFNRDLITADEIVAIIAATNEGQFNVIRTRSEPYVKESETSDTAASSDAATTTSKVTVKTRSYASVSGGFFDLFSWL